MRNRILMVMLASAAYLFSPTFAPPTEAQTSTPSAMVGQPMKIQEPFTLAAVGDVLDRLPIMKLAEPGFHELVQHLIGADLAFANQENPIIDSTIPSGGGIRSHGIPKTIVSDLKAMGIDMVNLANNHPLAVGEAGLYSTLTALNEAGIVHAGAGKDLQDARAARFLATPKGLVGLVGMFSIDDASSYSLLGYTAASYSMGGVAGTPGTNGLRLKAYHIVSAEQLQSLRKIHNSIFPPGNSASKKQPADHLELFGRRYKVGPNPGAISYTMDPVDLRETLRSIRNGKVYADFMIATIHCHQYGLAHEQREFDPVVPDFLIDLAHQAIDNGADAFVAHGVHQLRGVEIYKGKPIFYGLSNFLFGAPQAPTEVVPSLSGELTEKEIQGRNGGFGVFNFGNPKEAMEPILATSRYEGGRVVEVRLYPADLGQDDTRPVSRMGIPMTPSPEMARRVLERMQAISKPLGTTISIENNIGVIRVPPETQQSRR